MKKKLLITSLTAVFLASAVLIGAFAIRHHAYSVEPLTAEMLADSGIDSASKLMIAAHPDDEVIWGGGHLMDGGYFIICITNGRNKTRSAEFQSVLDASGNRGIILDYPDKVLFRRDDWENVSDGIIADLELAVGYKNWDMIVTHNENGEYGHQHHKLTNGYVTSICKDRPTDLRFFGKYYKKSDIDAHRGELTPITAEQLRFKVQLEELYVSQSRTVEKLRHMNEYEMWTEYNEQEN